MPLDGATAAGMLARVDDDRRKEGASEAPRARARRAARAAREERLAAALRANLKKRKRQSRARTPRA